MPTTISHMTIKAGSSIFAVLLLFSLLPAPLLAEEPATITAASPLVIFPAGKTSVTLKLKTGIGFLLAEGVKVNGRDAGTWVIDTGANISLLDTNLARRLNVKPASADLTADVAAIGKLEIAGLQFSGQRTMGVVNISSKFLNLGMSVDGVLGTDVLGLLPFKVSAQDLSITWFDRTKFAPPPKGTRWPFEIIGRPDMSDPGLREELKRFFVANPYAGQPMVQGKIDGIACTLMLDSGFNGPLSINEHFTAAHPQFNGRGPSLLQTQMMVDRGKSKKVRPAKLELFDQTVTGLAGSDAFIGANATAPVRKIADVTVGARVMENFDLTFDYANKLIWTEWRPVPTVEARLAAHTLAANAKDAAGVTPLMIAAQRDDLTGCAALLKAGAQIDAQNRGGTSALHYALENEAWQTSQLLLKQPGADRLVRLSNNDGRTALMVAATLPDMKILDLILQAGADPAAVSRVGETALHYAAESNNPEAVKRLVAAKADVNAPSRIAITPLGLATEHGSIAAFEALVEAGAKFHAFSNEQMTLLHLAARVGQVEMVEHLLTKYGNRITIDPVTADGSTPLLLAAESGHPKVVAALLKAGARPGIAADGLGRAMPLHMAARNGNPETIALLIKAKAPVDAPNKQGLTPLMAASDAGQVAAVEALLDAGASIDAKDTDGMTSIHYAARENRGDLVRALVKRGASPNAKGPRGVAPLHLAILNGAGASIEALIECKADPAALTDGGVSAIDLAQRSGSKKLIEMLKPALK